MADEGNVRVDFTIVTLLVNKSLAAGYFSSNFKTAVVLPL